MKKKILSIAVILVVLFGNSKKAQAIGVPVPIKHATTSASEIHGSIPKDFSQYTQTVNLRIEKIFMLSNSKMVPLVYMNGPHSYINTHLLKKLRSGYLPTALTVVAIGTVVYIMCHFSGVDAFSVLQEMGNLNAPTVDPHFGLNQQKYIRSKSSLRITRPTSISHEEFESLTKSERRQIPHFNDGIIDVKNRPRLRVGFWQVRYKTPDHGAMYGLPFVVKANGGTRTLKNDENALIVLKSITEMPSSSDVEWFDKSDVTYQGNTKRGFSAVCIFNTKTKIVAVFNKKTGFFVTTCQLTGDEETELRTTHNFGNEKNWIQGQAKNLPPKGITLIDSVDLAKSITPIASFESDVMSITPRID